MLSKDGFALRFHRGTDALVQEILHIVTTTALTGHIAAIQRPLQGQHRVVSGERCGARDSNLDTMMDGAVGF